MPPNTFKPASAPTESSARNSWNVLKRRGIYAEEALATPDHSMTAMEEWDDAHFKEEDAHEKATKAREAYKDAVREANYGM